MVLKTDAIADLKENIQLPSKAVDVETEAPKAESTLKSLFAGGVGGMCCVLTGHPFDLIKVRMQAGGVAGGSSVFGVLRSTLVKEGLPGIYRGVSAPITAISPIYALSFWGYDIGQRIVKKYKTWNEGPQAALQALNITELCVAGGISAIPATALMAPSERIKCLLQVQTAQMAKPQYNGMVDCATKILRSGGITSLYKGTALTLMRDVPGSIAWFGTYEVVKMRLMKMQGIEDASTLSPSAVLFAGGVAGMACWGVCLPVDVLKSRYQTAPEGKYSGFVDVYRKLMAEEGAGALFAGFRPAMIRAFPANAACFFGMEVARKFLAFMD